MVWRPIYYTRAKAVWMIKALALSSVYVERCLQPRNRRQRPRTGELFRKRCGYFATAHYRHLSVAREYLRTVALRLSDQMRLPRNGCSIICEEAARMVWCQIVQHPQDALGGFIRL